MSNLEKMISLFNRFFPFISPLLILIIAIIYVSYLGQADWKLLGLFYLFSLIQQFIENKLTNQEISKEKASIFSNPILEIINLLILALIFIHFPIRIGIILLMYSLIIHIQFVFVQYNKSMLALIILALFKAFILPNTLFLAQLNFMTGQFIRLCVSLAPPIFMLDYNRFARKLSRNNILNPLFNRNWQRKILLTSFLLSTTISTMILWPLISWPSLVIIVVSIIIFYLAKHLDDLFQKNFVRIYFVGHLLTYNLLCLVYYQLII